MTLSVPSYDARCKIFDLYLSKYSSLDHIDRETLAKKSNGLTGADINNLTNEVLLECRTRNVKPTIDDFERYIPSILFKDIRRENDVESLQYVAAHEVGHFICTYILKNEISSISIDKYADVAGFVMREKQKVEFSKYSSLMDDLTILLGGLAGEKVFLNDITTGASSDIEKAYDLIYNMMNVGAFGFEYFKREKRSYADIIELSETTLKMREDKIAEILNECLTHGQTIIENNKHIYNLLIDELLVERRLSSERINQILTGIKK
jgi:cell division protease FtsH